MPDVSSIGPKRPCRRPPATLHGVVFDIFGWELQRRGVAARILLEAAHAGEAFSVAEWRARRDSNFRSGFLVKMSSGDFLFDLNRSLDSDRAPGSGFSREQTSARHSSMDLVTLPASRPAPSPVPAFCRNPPRSLDRDGEKVITKVVAGIGFEPMTFRL